MPDAAALADKSAIDAARNRLDAHVREIVQWHFDPATGCPFWLERAKQFDFNPLTDIKGYADLGRFGFFEDEWLRGGPVERWVPKGIAGKPIYVFETGGSTGVPKSRINYEDFRIDYSNFSDTLPEDKFPKGSNWLMVGPSGPRRLRLAIEHLAQHRGGICFMVDLDPRWVIKLIKKGWTEHLNAYKDHVIDQARHDPRRRARHQVHVHDAEAARSAGAAARGDGIEPPTRPASPEFSPAARSSRRSGTASRTRSCSTAPT